MQIVIVRFTDSTTFGHWASVEEVERRKPKICVAAGVLVEENEELIKIALLCSMDGGEYANWVVIPTPWVISCDVIKEVAND